MQVPIEARFVRAVVEDLEELRPPKVEHELRVEGEVVRQPEAVGVVLVELAELLTLKNDEKSTKVKIDRKLNLAPNVTFDGRGIKTSSREGGGAYNIVIDGS